MLHLKKAARLIFVTLSLLAGVTAYTAWKNQPRDAQPLCLTHHVITKSGDLRIAVVDEPRTIRTGLMFRKDLDSHEGMLFMLGGQRVARFWMKNTVIPLDIIFLDSDFKVIRVSRGVPMSLSPIESGSPSPMVLEVPAGAAEMHGLSEGVRLSVPARIETPPSCRD